MKLDWEINECRVLTAVAGEDTYFISPGVVNLWNPHKQNIAFDGVAGVVRPIEGGMSLANAIAWCERDAECPAQPPAAKPDPVKTPGEMSGEFPLGLNPGKWAIGVSKLVGVGWTQACILKLWFKEAMSRSRAEGEAAAYKEIDAAQRKRDIFGPGLGTAADLARPVTQVDMEQHVAKALAESRGCDEARLCLLEESLKKTQYNWNADLKGLRERLEKLEAQFADTRMCLHDRIEDVDGDNNELYKRLSDLEARVMGNSAELPMWGRRVEELESVVRSGVGGYMYDPRIDEFLKRLTALEQRCATADEARKP